MRMVGHWTRNICVNRTTELCDYKHNVPFNLLTIRVGPRDAPLQVTITHMLYSAEDGSCDKPSSLTPVLAPYTYQRSAETKMGKLCSR